MDMEAGKMEKTREEGEGQYAQYAEMQRSRHASIDHWLARVWAASSLQPPASSEGLCRHVAVTVAGLIWLLISAATWEMISYQPLTPRLTPGFKADLASINQLWLPRKFLSMVSFNKSKYDTIVDSDG